MHHEAVVVAVDVGGRVGLELHRDVGHGSEQLEVRPRAAILTQDVRRQVVPVVEGQEVVLPQVQSETGSGKHGAVVKRQNMSTVIGLHLYIHSVSTTQGDSQLISSSQSEVPCSGTFRHSS